MQPLRKLSKLLSTTMAFLSLVLGPMSQGCARRTYNVGFLNKSGHNLEAVSAYFNGVQVAFPGGLNKEGLADEGPVSLPIPSEAEVRWSDQGSSHSVKVTLKDAVPEGFSRGTIYFVIRENGSVEAKAVNRGNSVRDAVK